MFLKKRSLFRFQTKTFLSFVIRVFNVIEAVKKKCNNIHGLKKKVAKVFEFVESFFLRGFANNKKLCSNADQSSGEEESEYEEVTDLESTTENKGDVIKAPTPGKASVKTLNQPTVVEATRASSEQKEKQKEKQEEEEEEYSETESEYKEVTASESEEESKEET
ncbi:hypothetical protein RFI_32783, partial [Reticulomyxa filosa]